MKNSAAMKFPSPSPPPRYSSLRQGGSGFPRFCAGPYGDGHAAPHSPAAGVEAVAGGRVRWRYWRPQPLVWSLGGGPMTLRPFQPRLHAPIAYRPPGRNCSRFSPFLCR